MELQRTAMILKKMNRKSGAVFADYGATTPQEEKAVRNVVFRATKSGWAVAIRRGCHRLTDAGREKLASFDTAPRAVNNLDTCDSFAKLLHAAEVYRKTLIVSGEVVAAAAMTETIGAIIDTHKLAMLGS